MFGLTREQVVDVCMARKLLYGVPQKEPKVQKAVACLKSLEKDWIKQSTSATWAVEQLQVRCHDALQLVALIDLEIVPTPDEAVILAGLSNSNTFTVTKANMAIDALGLRRRTYAWDDVTKLANNTARVAKRYSGPLPARRGDLVRWLVSLPYSQPLRDLIWEIGDRLPNGPLCWGLDEYLLSLAEQRRRNESGELAETANRTILHRGGSLDPADIAIYEKGRLPEWHLEAISKKATMRKIVTEFHHQLSQETNQGALTA